MYGVVGLLTVPRGDARIFVICGGVTTSTIVSDAPPMPTTASTAQRLDADIRAAVAELFTHSRVDHDDEDVSSVFTSRLRTLLATYGEAALPAVRDRMSRRSTDPELVFFALQVLAEDLPQASVTMDIVVLATSSEDVEIRFGAALALTQIAQPRAKSVVQRLLDSERSPSVSGQLRKALVAIGA